MALPVSDAALPTINKTIHESKSAIRIGFVEKEMQISVDPISLKKESSTREEPFVPVISTQKTASDLNHPPPLPPMQSRFLSHSLPTSATTSPRFSKALMKKEGTNENQESPLKLRINPTPHSRHLNNFEQEIQLRRSKSCGEGRAIVPSDDLDLWLKNPNVVSSNTCYYDSSSKTDHEDEKDYEDGNFKCGALCLFLPGFSNKGKHGNGRSRSEESVNDKGGRISSRTVSLEKFECGSWASSAIVHERGDDKDSMSSSTRYFDLPMELMRDSVDAHMPVAAAFVFDKDRKGVLKNGSIKSALKSQESPSRHVRFSTSSSSGTPLPASCITPRLCKARQEFNAFLEAQGAYN